MLTQVLQLLGAVALTGGGIWLVWGVVVFAGGLKDHAGPQIQQGIWQMLGGGMIIAVAGWFTTNVPVF